MSLKPFSISKLDVSSINLVLSDIYNLLARMTGEKGTYPGTIDMGGNQITNAEVDGYLKSDGSVTITGDLDFDQNQAKNMVIHEAKTIDKPARGQKRTWDDIEYGYYNKRWRDMSSGPTYNRITITGKNVETLTGNKILTIVSPQFQVLNPDGVDRDIVLPNEANSTGYVFFILNTGSADYLLIIKNNADTVIVNIGEDEGGFVYCDGTNWYGYRMFKG